MVTFDRHNGILSSSTMNFTTSVPQTYSINPIQPPQEKSTESFQDTSIVISEDQTESESQSIGNDSPQTSASNYDSEPGYDSEYDSDYDDDAITIPDDMGVPPAPPYDDQYMYSITTSEIGRRIFLKYRSELYLLFFLLS